MIENILLLDIDGVFNSLGKLDKPLTFQKRWSTLNCTIENYRFLKELSTYKNTKIIWISSWNDESNLLNQAAGIEDFEVGKTSQNSKKEIIRELISKYQGHRIIVVDDEHFKKEYSEDPNVFFVNPNPISGLNRKDRNQIAYLLDEENIRKLLE